MRLARTLQQERRHATPDEQATLATYVGWGASDVADFLRETPRRTWSANEHAIWQDLRDVTTEARREQLRGSATNAHFTYDLYQPIWDVLMAAGFRGGRVLEPAVGTGHAFGLMPVPCGVPAERRRARAVHRHHRPGALPVGARPGHRLRTGAHRPRDAGPGHQQCPVRQVRRHRPADERLPDRPDPRLLLRPGARGRAAGRARGVRVDALHHGQRRGREGASDN
jgi:hypothetical protein